MEVGDRDLLNPNLMRDNTHDWVLANEHTAKALADKGYHYQFSFVKNAGHCDGSMKQQLLPEALEYVWQGYPWICRGEIDVARRSGSSSQTIWRWKPRQSAITTPLEEYR